MKAAVEELQECNGSTALLRVLELLDRCKVPRSEEAEKKKNEAVEKKNTNYEVLHDKIPFKYHFGIFASLLQNRTSIETEKLMHAFCIYFTQAAYSLHQYRLNDKPFSTFFQNDPPSLRQQPRWVYYPKFRLGDGQKLKEFLKAEAERFSEIPEKEPLKMLIQRLLEEITEVLQIEAPSPNQFWSASTPTLVEAVHTMLGEYLKQYEALIEKIPIADDKGETLLRAAGAYLKLHYFMARMHHLIKSYMCLIDGDPEVTFNFKITPVPATKDQGFDSTSENHSTTSVKRWGDCDFEWLKGLVEQAGAARWLWYERNKYVFDKDFLISNTPAAEPLHREQPGNVT